MLTRAEMESRIYELERELEALRAEHEKVLAALPPRYLDPVADGGGAWHYELRMGKEMQ